MFAKTPCESPVKAPKSRIKMSVKTFVKITNNSSHRKVAVSRDWL